MAKRKPSTIEVGKAYRLYATFSRSEPGDVVALVTEIQHTSKTTRIVFFECLQGDLRCWYGWAEFRARVYSEEPSAIH